MPKRQIFPKSSHTGMKSDSKEILRHFYHFNFLKFLKLNFLSSKNCRKYLKTFQQIAAATSNNSEFIADIPIHLSNWWHHCRNNQFWLWGYMKIVLYYHVSLDTPTKFRTPIHRWESNYGIRSSGYDMTFNCHWSRFKSHWQTSE